MNLFASIQRPGYSYQRGENHLQPLYLELYKISHFKSQGLAPGIETLCQNKQ